MALDRGAPAQEALLDVRNLTVTFPVSGGLLRRRRAEIRAVDGVSFTVRPGETLGLVGESGCGKSTVGRSLIRLVEPAAGEAYFRLAGAAASDGRDSPAEWVNLLALAPGQMKPMRRHIQMIFQDPSGSLNPRMKVGELLREPFVIHRVFSNRKEIDARIDELLHTVGLPVEYRDRYPHQLSGGQKQRIGIARALALRPQLVIADEPVSALDVSIQGQILNLLADLQEQFGLTYLFISHNLAVVEHIADRVAVMYLGRLVELAATADLYRAPKHPYTEALLSAVPVPDPEAKRARIVLEGDIPSPLNPPGGCPFHPRCPYARASHRAPRCAGEVPVLRPLEGGRLVACHFAEELALRGVPEAGSEAPDGPANRPTASR